MMRRRRVVQESAAIVEQAINYACQALADRRVEHEPPFTDRMLAAIERELDGRRLRGIVWHAKTLTSQGQGSQEKRFGADFVGVLSVDLPESQVRKGFLAQAKRIEEDAALTTAEFARLKEQCEEMLNTTPASFVFLYAETGVRVVPALSIVAVPAGGRFSPDELYSRSASSFFEAHFECFVGDRAIATVGDSMMDLPAIMDRVRAERAIELSVAEEALG